MIIYGVALLAGCFMVGNLIGVAMSSIQNVAAALSGGVVALAGGALAVAVGFLLIPVLAKKQPSAEVSAAKPEDKK